jgi:hypothetical protein
MSLRVELDKELERRFRELAMRRYGYSKGSIKKATEMAIKKWSTEASAERPLKEIKDPLKLIEGGLSHLRGKFTSVELQHEATKIWPKRTMHYKKE